MFVGRSVSALLGTVIWCLGNNDGAPLITNLKLKSNCYSNKHIIGVTASNHFLNSKVIISQFEIILNDFQIYMFNFELYLDRWIFSFLNFKLLILRCNFVLIIDFWLTKHFPLSQSLLFVCVRLFNCTISLHFRQHNFNQIIKIFSHFEYLFNIVSFIYCLCIRTLFFIKFLLLQYFCHNRMPFIWIYFIILSNPV